MKLRHVLFPCLLLGLWSLLSYTGFVSEFFLATPSETARAFFRLLGTGEILRDLIFSICRILAGLIIGSTVGMLAGCAIGMSPRVWDVVEGTVDFFRSLPAFALFPFFILVFGPGDSAKVATAAWFVAFIMLIASAYAVRNTSSTRANAARALGATRLQTFLFIVIPHGIPQLMVGFRTALAFAPIVVVATEMFSGTRHGLGDRIYEARLVYRVPEMFATLLVAGVLGYGLNKGFTLLCHRVIHWTGK